MALTRNAPDVPEQFISVKLISFALSLYPVVFIVHGHYPAKFMTEHSLIITFVEHFGNGKKFDTELHTRLLTLVDDPPLSVVVRMDVSMGKFHHLCMSQARKGAEDEDIPVDARSVVVCYKW